MATRHNWVTSNIVERLKDPTLDLKVNINPYQFVEMTFHEAADYTANLIKNRYDKIFLAFSGGADSDFVFHCFQRCGVPFTPVIVKSNGNKKELEYAYKTCDKFGVTPHIIDMDDELFLKIHLEYVIKKIHGYGVWSIPSVVACMYAKQEGGVLVIGEHLIEGEKPDENGIVRLRPAANEWDFYNECFIGEAFNIPFFTYTLELSYAMIKQIGEDTIDEFKHRVYGIEHRPIIGYEEFEYEFYTKLNWQNRARERTANPHVSLGEKEEFLKYLDKWKINV
jgi:hypothetical protein